MSDLAMYELVPAPGHGGENAVVPLVRDERAEPEKAEVEAGAPLPFRDRFDTIRMTPRDVADAVVDDGGVFRGLSIDGERYSPSQRFLKGLAQRMKVPLGVFELFTPLEAIRRAAERAPDLPLRLTLDRGEHLALALVEDKGVPLPAGNIEAIMREDPRLQEFHYHDGVISGRFDLGEAWDIPGDSKYGVHINTEVPVDGMGTPATTLATWRQVCSNGAVAEAPMFRTKMEIKDNSGEHFRRLLKSFSNPRGIELLHERLMVANATKASVDEVFQAESFIRRQIRDSRHQMLLCERLQDVAENPCVRYGVTDLGAIGERRRGLLPTGASVADVMNFVSELNTHHGALLRNQNAANALIGEFFAGSFDLEEMYPHTRAADQYYLRDVDLGEKAMG